MDNFHEEVDTNELSGNELPKDEVQADPSTLESMGVRFMEQDSLERQVAESADKAMLSKEVELDEKRLETATKKYEKIMAKIRSMETKIESGSLRISEKEKLKEDLRNTRRLEKIPLEKDIFEIRERLDNLKRNSDESTRNNESLDDSAVQQLPSETRQEFLIRTGQLTAFGTSTGFVQENSHAEQGSLPSHQNLLAPGIINLDSDQEVENDSEDEEEVYEVPEGVKSDDEYIDSKESDFEDEEYAIDAVSDNEASEIQPSKKQDVFENIDDGDESIYQTRLKKWIKRRSELRAKLNPQYQDDPNIPEWKKPHPTEGDAVLNDEFKIPGDIFPSLFDYQKTCVQWLWELFAQKTGGIIGDEMGLGKTIQIISFLASLQYSGKLDKPILIVCPATVLRQWCNEFHKWWPPLRTVILHSIGTGMTGKKSKKRSYDEYDEDSLEEMFDNEDEFKNKSSSSIQMQKNAEEMINRVFRDGGVIITTYVGVRIYSKYLLRERWGYVVLDEGHKIRNPDSYITLNCKQLKTPNRVILSGTPIQNNLVELWSLFDFVFPGRLGTLPVFQAQFCVPINLGGYANATNVQVKTGYKCAVILRDLISPYLLRRVKADVAKDLPKKSEMVLFCNLTSFQRRLYERFLSSEDLSRILNGKRNALYGIDVLRKVCNHPDLVQPNTNLNSEKKPVEKATNIEERSGKLPVVHTLLDLWVKEGHKCLIFTQTKQMLNILQDFLEFLNKLKTEKERINYLRMDGSTNISVRQSLVDKFNRDPHYNVFLLTTRVGGLGVNLTGASRVIIYDPDWNPSTDLQARERAWRLGQKKDVAIYRLMIAGSIEEKIYHRQIFKQFLTNKILKDPKQRRFFKMTDLHDLFTLGDQDTVGTETADLFGTSEVNFSGAKPRSSKFASRGTLGGTNDDFLEVSKMKGIKSLEKYHGEDDAVEDGEKEPTKEEDGLMASIFSKTGVHSAVQHDAIMSSDGVPGGSNLIDQEASRIANDAVKALRDSRKETRRAGSGTPTWTGRSGRAGKVIQRTGILSKRQSPSPGPVSRLLPNSNANSSVSSSSILSNIRNKKGLGSTSPSPSPSPSNGVSEEKELIIRLSNYMAGLDGYFSKSEDILDSLKINLSNEKTVRTVRSMLKSICKWDKIRKGWILNEEFR